MGVVAGVVGGVLGDVVGGVFGSKTANKAADAQTASADQAIRLAEESRDIAREDLAPFRDAGTRAVGELESLVTDPDAQAEFIENNPFFEALQRQTTENLLGARAASGKKNSGGTQKALQEALTLLGSDLLNQRVTQLSSLTNTGQASAAGSAKITQDTAQQVGDLRVQQGNASAAGQIAKGRIQAPLFQQGAQAAGQAAITALCDFHAKENIHKIGRLKNGLPLYLFNYKGHNEKHINVMAQDVEQVMPEAIIYQNGMKYVNMEAVLWQE